MINKKKASNPPGKQASDMTGHYTEEETGMIVK